MPPRLALLLTLGFIVYLFRRDFRERPNVTGALWIPLIWLLIIGSRYVSIWLGTFGISTGGFSLQEGSPLDALVFFALIAAGLHVLAQRRVTLSEAVANNRCLALFLVYCLVSIAWSDFPFVAFKRWVKVLGHPIMVLVLLTEPDPQEAFIRLMKRCAYIFVPVSILFIKYFPEYGRVFEFWNGMPTNVGITTNKNELGYVCLFLGFFFFWNLKRTFKLPRGKPRRDELVLTLGFLLMLGWLLWMAKSSTCYVALLVAIAVLLGVSLSFVNQRFLGTYVIVGVLLLAAANSMFGLYNLTLEVLGKNATLTDRTEVWHDVLQFPINPVLGTGFESFWLGERLQTMWAKWAWHPNQAHNGYLETYLNLGIVGVAILIALLVATFLKAKRDLAENPTFGGFRLGFLAAVLVYNWTEASFKALHPIWFIFYIIATDYPRVPAQASQTAANEANHFPEDILYASEEPLD